MRSVLVVIAYFAFTANGKTLKEFAAEMDEQMTQVGMECAEKLKTSEAAMKELTSHKIPTEHDGKCVILCLNQHYGWMDDKNNFDIPKGLESVASLKEIDAEMYEKFTEGLESCKDVKDDDPCEMAVKGLKCLVDEMGKKGVTEMFGLEMH